LKTFRQTRLGFTIIEVMLAIGIFSMILLAIYSVWTGILKASKAARTAADNAQRARISMRALQDALTTAQMFTANMPPQNPDAYYSFLADTSGDYGSLSFVAHLPATFPGVGRFGDNVVRRVTFTIEQDKAGGLDLVMRQAPVMYAANPDYEPYSLVLAKDVQSFGFEFWGQKDPVRNPLAWDWVDEWKSTNSLPSLVRVWLALGKTAQRGQAQDVVVNVIALPATAVPPDWQMPGLMGGGIPPGGRMPPGGGRVPPGTGIPPGGGGRVPQFQ
jgi:prepilin-type N-terminal cleavage/methylation domain-containing protein